MAATRQVPNNTGLNLPYYSLLGTLPFANVNQYYGFGVLFCRAKRFVLKMHEIFTSSLWYIEFFAVCVVFIALFNFIMYLGELNAVEYTQMHDFRAKPRLVIKTKEDVPRVWFSRDVFICCDAGCIWLCRVIGTVASIALCYYFAYALVSATKLRFSLFMG